MRKSLLPFLAVLLGLAALSAAGCTPTESYWSGAESPKQNRVEPVRLLHDVRFPSGAKLSPNEEAQLDDFLMRHDIGYGDRVYVLTDARGAGGASAERTKTVVSYMAANGIKAASLPSPEAQPGIVRIVVNRYVVVPPNCPDWSKPATADYSNTPMSNLGCATAANFGLMVADPSELVQGRTPGAADATGTGLAIQRYRVGKIRPIKPETTSNVGSGSE